VLLGDEWRHDVLSRSRRCFICLGLGPSSVRIGHNFLCCRANGISCPLLSIFDDVVVDNTQCSGVVRLHWCRRLGMIHEFKSMASKDGLSGVYVESSHLGLRHQGHDRFDYLRNCEDGAIVW
jgi:hypothetical protein